MQHVYSCSTPSPWSRLYNATRIQLFHHPITYIMQHCCSITPSPWVQHVYCCSITPSPWSRLYNYPGPAYIMQHVYSCSTTPSPWSRLYNAARILLFHHPGPAYIMQHVYCCTITPSPWSRLYRHPDILLSYLQFSLFRDYRKKLNNKKSSNISALS